MGAADHMICKRPSAKDGRRFACPWTHAAWWGKLFSGLGQPAGLHLPRKRKAYGKLVGVGAPPMFRPVLLTHQPATVNCANRTQTPGEPQDHMAQVNPPTLHLSFPRGTEKSDSNGIGQGVFSNGFFFLKSHEAKLQREKLPRGGWHTVQ